MTERMWSALAVAAMGTFLIRASFLAFAHQMRDVGPVAQSVLRMIPPAALAGLVLPSLVAPDGDLDLGNPRLWAGCIAALAGWWSKQTLVTLGAGLVALLVLEPLIG